jgi:hypothetical protein
VPSTPSRALITNCEAIRIEPSSGPSGRNQTGRAGFPPEGEAAIEAPSTRVPLSIKGCRIEVIVARLTCSARASWAREVGPSR